MGVGFGVGGDGLGSVDSSPPIRVVIFSGASVTLVTGDDVPGGVADWLLGAVPS